MKSGLHVLVPASFQSCQIISMIDRVLTRMIAQNIWLSCSAVCHVVVFFATRSADAHTPRNFNFNFNLAQLLEQLHLLVFCHGFTGQISHLYS